MLNAKIFSTSLLRISTYVLYFAGIRGLLSRNHFNHIEHEQKLKIENEKDVRNLPKDIDENVYMIKFLAYLTMPH